MTLDPASVLLALGGHAPYRRLAAATGRAGLRRAAVRGEVVSLGRGRYALPSTDQDLTRAVGDGGCLSWLSAATHHGWGVASRPATVHVTVPLHAHRSGRTTHVRHYADLSQDELTAGVTSPLRTVVDCARHLPLPQALAVADSALRAGAVHRLELEEAADAVRGPGSPRARRVLLRADERAANAFESVLRGHLIAAGMTGFVPQLVVHEPGLLLVADLGDADARVVLEADGYGVHGTRRAFAADLARHDELQSAGWVTRRFAWEHVMHRPDWVVAQTRAALSQRIVRRPPMRTKAAVRTPRAA